MGDSLCIGRNTVVHLAGEMDMFGAERREDIFNEFEAFVRCSVLDEDLDHCVTNACPMKYRIQARGWPYQRLALRIHFGAV